MRYYVDGCGRTVVDAGMGQFMTAAAVDEGGTAATPSGSGTLCPSNKLCSECCSAHTGQDYDICIFYCQSQPGARTYYRGRQRKQRPMLSTQVSQGRNVGQARNVSGAAASAFGFIRR